MCFHKEFITYFICFSHELINRSLVLCTVMFQFGVCLFRVFFPNNLSTGYISLCLHDVNSYLWLYGLCAIFCVKISCMVPVSHFT